MTNHWAQSATAGTVGSAFISAALAAGALALVEAHDLIGRGQGLPNPTVSWHVASNQPTFGTANISIEPMGIVIDALLEAVRQTASQQIALDPEIAEIISRNLWDLYGD